MDQLSTSISLSRTVNLGQFESGRLEYSVSGITPETTEEDIEALLDNQGALAYRAIADRMKIKVQNLRKGDTA